jgi:hypothetical protein
MCTCVPVLIERCGYVINNPATYVVGLGLISCKFMRFPHVYCYGCPQYFQANSEIGRNRCLPYTFEFISRKPFCYLFGVVEKIFLND